MNKDIIKSLVHNYFIIFACCVMFMVFLNPDVVEITTEDLRYVMLCAACASLPKLILYFPRECSARYEKIRMVIHFVVLEAVVITFISLMNWANVLGKFVIMGEVAIIYVIIKVLSYRGDQKTAKQINEKLKSLKEDNAS